VSVKRRQILLLRHPLTYLRPRIYGYLLDGKHTKVKRVGTSRVFYKFHTNILGVNRQVYEEAAKYLYEHNTFVVVCHNASALMPPWIPLVAELGTRPMKYPSLEITILLRHVVSQFEKPVGASLLLADDLELFCAAFSFYMSRDIARRTPPTPMFVLHRDGSLHDNYRDANGFLLTQHYLSLEFSSHRFCEATAEFQTPIISRVRSLSSASLRVEICGYVVQTPELKDFRLFKRWSLVCATSLAWRIFWHCDSLKELADLLAHDGELALADLVYQEIWSAIRTSFFLLLPPPDVLTHVEKLIADTALTSANLHLTTNDIPGWAKLFLDRMPTNMRAWTSASALSCAFHVRLLSTVISESYSREFPYMTIAECIAELTLPGSDSHQLHDAAILQKCPDHTKRFESGDIPVKSCSAYALPPNCVNLRKVDADIKTPDNIVGLLDTRMLRDTSHEMREEINRKQTERGWLVTRFEDYD
jgi:hypothetical protein